MEITGFSLAEVDLLIEEARDSSPDPEHAADNHIPPLADPVSAVTRCGDLWLLDRHRLLCGDSRHSASYDHLLQDERADLIFTDPPFNVPIDGHVCGSAASAIASSPWGPARCRGRPSRGSCKQRSVSFEVAMEERAFSSLTVEEDLP